MLIVRCLVCESVVPPEVAKSEFDASGSEADVNKAGTRVRAGGTTFDTAGLTSHYTPIDSYEGKHRYDPDFEWEPEEERRVVRKVRNFSYLYQVSAQLTPFLRSISESVPGCA